MNHQDILNNLPNRFKIDFTLTAADYETSYIEAANVLKIDKAVIFFLKQCQCTSNDHAKQLFDELEIDKTEWENYRKEFVKGPSKWKLNVIGSDPPAQFTVAIGISASFKSLLTAASEAFRKKFSVQKSTTQKLMEIGKEETTKESARDAYRGVLKFDTAQELITAFQNACNPKPSDTPEASEVQKLYSLFRHGHIKISAPKFDKLRVTKGKFNRGHSYQSIEWDDLKSFAKVEVHILSVMGYLDFTNVKYVTDKLDSLIDEKRGGSVWKSSTNEVVLMLEDFFETIYEAIGDGNGIQKCYKHDFQDALDPRNQIWCEVLHIKKAELKAPAAPKEKDVPTVAGRVKDHCDICFLHINKHKRIRGSLTFCNDKYDNRTPENGGKGKGKGKGKGFKGSRDNSGYHGNGHNAYNNGYSNGHGNGHEGYQLGGGGKARRKGFCDHCDQHVSLHPRKNDKFRSIIWCPEGTCKVCQRTAKDHFIPHQGCKWCPNPEVPAIADGPTVEQPAKRQKTQDSGNSRSHYFSPNWKS